MPVYTVRFKPSTTGATGCASTAAARDVIAKLALSGATVKLTRRGMVYVKTERGYLRLERVK